MAQSEREYMKIQNDEEFIEQGESVRHSRKIRGWYLMEPEELRRRNGMGLPERARLVPNENSIIIISMKNNQSYGCNCRRPNKNLRMQRRRQYRVSGRERCVSARRRRDEWAKKEKSVGIEVDGSEEGFSGNQRPGGNRREEALFFFKKLRMDKITLQRLKLLVSTFMTETSLHGLRQTCQGTPLRRMFYFCLVMSMSCFLAHVLIETFVDYRRFPYTQQYTASINNELNFPGITVCNLNNNRLEKDMLKMGNWTAEDYYNRFYDSINLVRCTFSQRNCTRDWIKQFISIQGEENLCLVFNVVLDPTEKETFTVSKLGIVNGLSVVLSLKPQDHEEVSYGVIVYLHESGLLPTEYEATFVAAPGYSTYAVINPEKMTVLGKPYRSETCLESPPYGYNLAQCERNCAYKYVESRCKCHLPFAPDNRLRKCLVREIPCIKKEHGIFLTKKNLSRRCKCLRRCSSTLYHTQIWTAYRPRNKTLSDHMEVNIFYQTLVMKEVKEVPKYSLDKILSQFGGQMGIFLGSSIVTVCEIMEVAFHLVLETFAYVLTRKDRR